MSGLNKMCLLSLLFLLSFANIAAGKTVYMNDGSEMEAQAAWVNGEKVYVRINTDLCLDFPTADVNLAKSGIRNHSAGGTRATGKGATTYAAKSYNALDELIRIAGHSRDFNDLFGRNDHSRFEEIYARTFTPALAEKALRAALGRKLSPREVAEVIAWYKTPVGKKIVEADSIWDFNMTENALTYVGNKAVQDLNERKKIAGEIDRLYGTSEFETRYSKQIMLSIINAIPADFPYGKDIKERLREEIPVLEVKRDEAITDLSYSYRFLSLPELRNYLRFLRSPAGNKYVGAVREASNVILQKVTRNVEKDLLEDIKVWAY